MKKPISLDEVLFDVGQVPIEAVIGSNGSTRRIQVPGKKALINERTGLAARPPDTPVFQKGRDTLEKRAGRWLKALARESQAAESDLSAWVQAGEPAARAPRLQGKN